MKQYHVLPHERGYAVSRTGARRASKVYAEKRDAIEDAKKRGVVVFVHRKDGMIEKMLTP